MSTLERSRRRGRDNETNGEKDEYRNGGYSRSLLASIMHRDTHEPVIRAQRFKREVESGRVTNPIQPFVGIVQLGCHSPPFAAPDYRVCSIEPPYPAAVQPICSMSAIQVGANTKAAGVSM